jgi:uncharacterized membrane protein YidH (DUF202 family)
VIKKVLLFALLKLAEAAGLAIVIFGVYALGSLGCEMLPLSETDCGDAVGRWAVGFCFILIAGLLVLVGWANWAWANRILDKRASKKRVKDYMHRRAQKKGYPTC